MRVIFFVSRNKDNKHIDGFKERKKSFVSTNSNEQLSEKFLEFVNKGRNGERCRLYVSLNERDNDKTLIELQHFLIDNPTFDLSKIERKVASISAKKQNAKTNKWLFDFDGSQEELGFFLEDLSGHEYEIHPSPNNFHVVVNRGFDTRELLSKWEQVELKRDGMLCIDWSINGCECK